MSRWFTLLALTVLATSVAAADLSITGITIEPSPALPGEPIWITLSITNNGTQTAPVPLAGLIEAVPEGGEPTTLRVLDRVSPPLKDYAEFRPTVAAGETLKLDFTNGRIAEGWLMQEPRLWQPGRHRLRVVLFDGWAREGGWDAVPDVPWTKLYGEGFLKNPPIASPDALFLVRQPSGVDAEAWNEFMRRTEGFGFNRGSAEARAKIAYDIATKFPDSAYAPYFALAASYKFRLASQRDAQRRFLADVAERHLANEAMAEVMRLLPANEKVNTARYDQQSDLAAALVMLDEGRAALETYAKEAPRLLTKLQLQKQIRELPTREDLANIFENREKNDSP